MNVNLKSLVARLNEPCQSALQGAAGLCLSRTNYDIELEHLFVKLLEASDTDLTKILRQYELNPSRLSKDITVAMEKLKTGNTRTPGIAREISDLIQNAWLLASVEFGEAKVRSGHLLLALLTNETLARLAREISKDFTKINVDELKENFAALTNGSGEARSAEGFSSQPMGEGGGDATAPGIAAAGKTKALDQFTVDLTARAKAGKIDPVLGRDFEVRQVVDILTRRRQNNPILTGEAGVGKTAVVEGFALRIAQGDVPEPLRNVAVRTLDLGLLQAGAGVKGEFENRLKTVIEEVKSSPQPIIIFIDEAHTMIGAGGQAGQNDAANLLKPALARGELRTIAATTWAEYKKYFEKDPALARRFQVVKVEEPDEEKGIIMMRGIVGALENHHKVRILDEAVEDSVRFSSRYISGRQLPDKSVSVLDTACAKVAIGQGATPAAIEDATRHITNLTTEINVLERETITGAKHEERIAELKAERATTEETLAKLTSQWDKEKELIGKIRELREKLEAMAKEGAKEGATDGAAELRTELANLNGELSSVQGETPLMQPVVTSQTIAEVISGWTGIPVGKMVSDEIQAILHLSDTLKQRVIGQDHALATIAERIKTSRAGLTDPKRPIGVFILVGTSGVGKTETALALAETLYGGERNLVSINMSEYQEAHTVSSLKGSPPGYVGYGEGGVLTEAVRRKPYSVVLLDEVEKAHPDVMELFYQVFDKGTLEDGEGRDIDFKNTVILLTSNIATDTIMKLCADPDTKPEPEGLIEAIRPELVKAFKPALLGRMTVVPYYPISDDILRLIIRLQLKKIGQRIAENHGASFTYDDAVIDAVAKRCTDVDSGARNVHNILNGTLLPAMSGEFLSKMAAGEPVSKVHISLSDDGQFQYAIS
ncbi:MAG: type VI secretion system ATPase TssH [Blastocatellia bacterium]|nr:type VI secretion system ATPase TssH [Blastocatellia bacterium]